MIPGHFGNAPAQTKAARPSGIFPERWRLYPALLNRVAAL